MEDCTFCDIINGALPCSSIYKDDTCMAFMDIQPINPGHVLVIPVAHASSLSELSEQDGAHMFNVAQKVAAAIRESKIPCEGVNLYLADGAAAGQEIFHVHLHVVPRFRGDGFKIHFGPFYGLRPGRGELDAVAEKIKDNFK